MLIGVGLATRVLYIGMFGDIDERDRDDHDHNWPMPSTRFVPGVVPVGVPPNMGMSPRNDKVDLHIHMYALSPWPSIRYR
jgi:hypothetical protein